ncbi:hypothetical protein [Sulfobacillus harzensis]|uniref:Uncharacterized protein n=1 Tax=Sulfobacillus harzensis TaxID=2729629 RepID=A0A7Y0L3Z3_9FIRM|nr:hypothetical protein [Sulfobacillus harzensis]NMP21474.1 hypothetical protein [Sulfobacillus harzensis]
MRGRVRFLAVGVALLVIVVLLSGFRRVTVTQFEPGPLAVKLPFGRTPDAVGRAVGIDGRVYGPLTFATNGHLTVIADTYRQRLLLIENGRITEVPTLNQLVEDLQVSRDGDVLVADNRRLAIWMLSHGRRKKVVEFTHSDGYTEALWHLGLGRGQKLYVEMVRFGHGTFAAQLDEYLLTGRFVRRLAESKGGRQEPLTPLSDSLIGEPVRNFQVAPDGDLYVEPASLSSTTRTITVYNPEGRFIRNVALRSPIAITHSDLLGVSRRGWIYLGVNLASRNHAQVLVANGDGHMVADLHVPAVDVYAATYGRVVPSGVLYLDQSTNKQYRLATYRPVTRRVWRWGGF